MEAVVFVGIQGSGKTTFYVCRFFDTHVRISLDLVRTRQRERILLGACLMAKQPFVVDNTNVRAEERAVYIEASKAAGFRVRGVYFDVEPRIALARNAGRTGRQRIPVPGVLGTYKRLEPPLREEGFDELEIVTPGEDGEFLVRRWEE